MDQRPGPAAQPNVLASAVAMAQAGYAVAPCRIMLKPDGKKAMTTGGPNWQTMSTTDAETVRGWFSPGGPHAGWSYLVDTEKSGIVAVDLDGPTGVAAWRELQLPGSLMAVRTRAGGYHGYYRADPAHPVYNTQSAIADHVDTRGIGGLVFGPGSMVEGHPDQVYVLQGAEPKPVEHLPVVPAAAMEQAMLVRGQGRSINSGNLTIERGQAYANLLAAEREVLELPVGYGVNTAIWHLGAEAGQYGGALGAGEDVVLAYVLDVVARRFGEPDEDDIRAATRGVHQGIETPWNFFTLRDLIGKDFNEAGLPLPGTTAITAEQIAGYAALACTPDQIAAEPEPPALVHGVIDAGTLGMIYGPGGSAKSFVALDLALSIAAGRDWFGHPVAAGRVCFVAAEGRRSTGIRTQAWRELNGTREPDGSMMIYGRAVDLFGQAAPDDWPAFVEYVRTQRYDVVILDTYNRCTPGLEENSAKETGVVVGRLAALAATGITVIVVHHTPKDGGKPRGSAALEWGTDWALSVAKDKAAVTITNARQKDREDGDQLAQLALVAAGPSAALALSVALPEPGPSSEWSAAFPSMHDLGAGQNTGQDAISDYLMVATGHGVGKTRRPVLQSAYRSWHIAVGSQRAPDWENARKIRENWTNQGKSLPLKVEGWGGTPQDHGGGGGTPGDFDASSQVKVTPQDHGGG